MLLAGKHAICLALGFQMLAHIHSGPFINSPLFLPIRGKKQLAMYRPAAPNS